MKAEEKALYKRVGDVALSVSDESLPCCKWVGGTISDDSFEVHVRPLVIEGRRLFHVVPGDHQPPMSFRVSINIPDHVILPKDLADEFPPFGRDVRVFDDGGWLRKGPWEKLLPLVLDELESQVRAKREEREAKKRQEEERKRQAISALWAAAEDLVETALARRVIAVEGR